jgi:hypothetical protein
MTEPSVELDALKAEIELFQQTEKEVASKLQRLQLDSTLPQRIEQLQQAVISSAD